MRRSSMSRRWILLIVVLFSAGRLEGGGNPGTCVSLGVVSTDPSIHSRVGPVFSATKVVDLTIRASISAELSGEHVLGLRFFGPQGDLYQTLDVPIGKPDGVAKERNLGGYPHPVKEVRPTSATVGGAKVFLVDSAFPVGGTTISQNGLYGKWRVEARMDGGEALYCTPAPFRINP
jgi:hypothetical protein